jgi:hypothetical protein
VSSNTSDGEVFSTQYYVIKFVSDLHQVSGFLRSPQPVKLTAKITEILLKVVLNTIILILIPKDIAKNDFLSLEQHSS